MNMPIARILRRSTLAPLCTVAVLLGGCSEGSSEAPLEVVVYGEEFIEDRITADVFIDGWEVQFSRFLIALSEIEADGVSVGTTFVQDLAVATDGQGHALATLDLPAGGTPALSFRVAPVPDGVEAVAPPDVAKELLLDARASLYVEGRATKGDQTVTFAWAFTTDTRYVECQSTAELVEDGMATSQLTIHADHLFYDDLDSEEPNVAFDLVASADANADGEVTQAELRAVDITGQSRYQVGSRDITDLWSFIEAQTSTLGHIDGEGHCELGS